MIDAIRKLEELLAKGKPDGTSDEEWQMCKDQLAWMRGVAEEPRWHEPMLKHGLNMLERFK